MSFSKIEDNQRWNPQEYHRREEPKEGRNFIERNGDKHGSVNQMRTKKRK